jgi:thioredoxin reductase
MRRVAVIGAGPIGLAAAASASERGFDVTVLEAGEVGASLRKWGPTKFFTPLSMNVRGGAADDSILTGPEYVDRVLVPLAAKLNVRTNTAVVSISRRGLTRTDYAGHPLRAERPFRIVTAGDEVFEADVVLDATGNTAVPLPFALRGARNVNAIRTLGELHQRKDELRGKRVLVVGHGHSAANALAVLDESGAEIIWAVRTNHRRPCAEIANDPLPERRRVAAFANDLAEKIRVERRATVESIDPNGSVTLSGNRAVDVDAIVALTGYRPASDFISELALEISPVTEGNARLWRAISNITDCLCTPKVGPQDLATGEPNYFFIGARAYGRSRTFLLQTGFAQVETLLESLND